jgi:hypothetical protein
MFCTRAQADMPSVPLDVTDILPTLLASPASDSSQAQLQLQPHLHVHTLSDPPSFSNDSLSIVKALVGTLDDDYLDLKSGSDKSNSQIPSPEAMFRSWDSYGAFASSGDTNAHNINISNVIGNGSIGGMGSVSTHTHCTSAVSTGTYANNIINNSNNSSSNSSNNTININLNTSKQPSSEKNIMYESVHDKSVLRNSAVWDPWKYGNTEPQRSFQLP